MNFGALTQIVPMACALISFLGELIELGNENKPKKHRYIIIIVVPSTNYQVPSSYASRYVIH